MTPANFLPEQNGELNDFEIVYRNGSGKTSHTVRQVKSLENALKSFAKSVPSHGRILKVAKVVPK